MLNDNVQQCFKLIINELHFQYVVYFFFLYNNLF